MSLLYLEKYRNAKIVPFNYYCLLLLLHPSNSLLCRKTSLDLNEARDDAGVWGWQWHLLDHMQTICTSLQRDNHTDTIFYRLHALPDAQPTLSKHWRHLSNHAFQMLCYWFSGVQPVAAWFLQYCWLAAHIYDATWLYKSCTVIIWVHLWAAGP